MGARVGAAFTTSVEHQPEPADGDDQWHVAAALEGWVAGGRRLLDRAPWLTPLVIGAIGAMLIWPFRSHPKIGVDLSWRLGLHQAAMDGLSFGSQIVFTYGPLGFLGRPTPFVGLTSALGFVAMVALYLAAFGFVFRAARRLFPLVGAVLVAFAMARLLLFIQPFEVVQWMAFGLAVEALRRDRLGHPSLVAVAVAVVTSIGVLGKVDVGVFLGVGGAVLVVTVSRQRVRDLTAYALALVVASLGLWLVTGQRLTDLGGYAHGAYEIITGYSDAMGVVHPRGRLLAALFALLAAATVVAAWVTSRDWSRARRLSLFVLLAILLGALWKQGFVRDHFEATFAALALTLLLLAPRTVPALTAALAVVLTLGVALGVAHVSPAKFLDPRPSIQQFTSQALAVVRPWRWDQEINRTRAWLAARFRVPPAILAEVAGRTVHVDPYAAGVATAYPAIIWDPVPVFQSYSAYTTYLDNLNADALRSPDRPARILRQLTVDAARPGTIHAVDGRFYWFESPAATLERLCQYREVAASGTWQVLQDTGRTCGPALTLSTVTAARGELVPVPEPPSPNELVIVRVRGTNDGVLGRLRTMVWKSPEWEVTLNGTPYRLVPGTAADGLVLSVPDESQGSGQFAFGERIRTISIRERGSSGGGELSYEFEAIPLPTH